METSTKWIIGGASLAGVVGGFWWYSSTRSGSRAKDDVLEGLLFIQGAFRAQEDLYRSLHWAASGPSAYGDHLLYERLYKMLPDQVDSISERIAGIYGSEALSADGLAQRAAKFVTRWSKAGTPMQQGLAAETEVIGLLRRTYDQAKAAGTLSLGLDDLLMSLSDQHEAAVYLLRQRAKGSANRSGLQVAVRQAQDAWQISGSGIRVSPGKGYIEVAVAPSASHLGFPTKAYGFPVKVVRAGG